MYEYKNGLITQLVYITIIENNEFINTILVEMKLN